METFPTAEQLKTWDRAHYWHAFTQMAEYEPFLIERAEGCVFWDSDGREYIDGVSSLWCNIHGHRHPKIDAAIRAQLDKVAHVTSLGASNSTGIRLAKRLIEIAPPGLSRVFFSDDGATAVEVAIKMSLQYWRQHPHPRPEKTLYLALGEAYHGDTLGSVSVGGVEKFHATFQPLLFPALRVPAPDAYRMPPGIGPEELCQFHLAQLECVLSEHHQKIAAMIVEPLVQGAAGMIMHPPGYLRGARELTKKYDVLFIADEVAVGFGRTGKMFACEHEAVTPDLMCLAKGITGGYLPLAATLATDEIYNAFLGSYVESKTFFHGHTYGGNPLAAAAALATLEIFEEERTLEKLQPKIARLAEHLARIARHPHVGDARQRGFIAAIELVRDKASKEPYPWTERRGHAVCESALREGVWIRPLGNVVVVMPPLAITMEQLDKILFAIERGIEKATGAAFSDSRTSSPQCSCEF
ncbi:MAG: adenosylmethionine--8-amino-7-oxononanoate transaminase [Pirellulales bacterium]|nr:adenosylmethionine--8-amino-7-oxononanoate transaminase [Pirellulales bacterium]